MSWSKTQTSFNAGELSPYLAERSDLQKYQNGCSNLENFIVLPYGGLYRRPGTVYVAATKNNGQARLIPFNFSTGDAFALEFGNLYIRFYKSGAQVESGGAPYELAAPWTAAQVRDIQFVQVNDVLYLSHPDHAPRRLARMSVASWTLTELFADNDEIRTGLVYPPFQDLNATETTVQVKSGEFAAWATATAYTAKTSKITQDDVLYVCVTTHTSAGTFQTDLAAGNWRHVGYDGTDYDTVTLTSSADVWDDGTNSRLIPEGSFMEVSFNRDASFVEYNILANGNSDILTGVFGTWNVRTYGIWSGTLKVERKYDPSDAWETIATFRSVSDRNVDSEGQEIKANAWYRMTIEDYAASTPAGTYTPRAVLEVQEQEVAGVVKVSSVTSKTEATVTALTLVYSGSATEDWREGAWNSNNKYPRAVGFHEQRLYFAGTVSQPQTFYGSEIDDYEDFNPGGTEASDPVTYTLASGNQNRVEWMVSKKKLIVGTSGAEWTVGSSNEDEPITPSNIVAKRHSSFGSKHIQAISVNEVTMFTQRSGRKVREFVYSFENDGYVAPDMTRLSEHVTEGEIVEWAYQQQRDQILWAVTGNGILAGFTYERREDVVAWHRHVTQGEFESCCVIYGTEENDELWVIVKRTIGGNTVRYVERFDPKTWNYKKESSSDLVYLDAAVNPPVGLVFGTTPLVFGGATLLFSVSASLTSATVSGLSHLAGSVVSILADGATHPKRLVSSTGTVTLDKPSYATATVGLSMVSRFHPMNLVTPAPKGSSQGRERKVHELVFSLYQSLGGTISTNRFQTSDKWLVFDSDELLFGTQRLVFGELIHHDVIPLRDTADDMDNPPPLYTGEVQVKLDGGHKDKGVYEFRTEDPLPMTLLAVTTKYNAPPTP